MQVLVFWSAFLLTLGVRFPAAGVYRCDDGKVVLRSDAALEMIQAQSQKLRGAVDFSTNSFAWTVEVRSFEGFNNQLQREHFNENYMESDKYPKASFVGKIIEQVDLAVDGTYTVRAKGKISVHGVEQERIIKSQVVVSGKRIHISSTFTVPLGEHNITIPRIVYQKIAEEITITIEADLKPGG
jgi:polyisoprenoid-binding protein YceI